MFFFVVEEKAWAIRNSEAQNSWLCSKKSPERYNGVGKLKVFKQNFTLMKLFSFLYRTLDRHLMGY